MRPKHSLLCEEMIIETAFTLLDEKGFVALSMRNIAQRLNVQAMSLYNHIQSKEDLLNRMVEMVVNEVQIPAPSVDWKADLRETALSFHETLLRHPNIIPIVYTHSPVTEKGLMQVEKILLIFKDIGITKLKAFSLMHIMLAYVIGHAGISIMNEKTTEKKIDSKNYDQNFSKRFPEIYEITFEVDKRNLKEEFLIGFNLFLDGVEKNIMKVG